MRLSYYIKSLLLLISLLSATAIIASSALPTNYSSNGDNIQFYKRGGGGNNHGGYVQVIFPDRPKSSQTRPKGQDRRIEIPLERYHSSPRSSPKASKSPSPPPGWKKSEGRGHTDPETGMFVGQPQFVREKPSRTQRFIRSIKSVFRN